MGGGALESPAGLKFGCRGWGEGQGREGQEQAPRERWGGRPCSTLNRMETQRRFGEKGVVTMRGLGGEDPGAGGQQGGSFGKWKARERVRSRPSTEEGGRGQVSWGITNAPSLDSQWLPGLQLLQRGLAKHP